MTFQVDKVFLDIPQTLNDTPNISYQHLQYMKAQTNAASYICSNDYFGEIALFIPNFSGNWPFSQLY